MMNILLFNKYCPECFGSDFEVVNEEFLYCCNCGLEKEFQEEEENDTS